MIQKVFFVATILLSSMDLVAASPGFQDGDIIFQISKSTQSRAIQDATRSVYSHMGVILTLNSKTCVFEAVSTVKCTPLEEWISRGERGHFVVQRTKRDLLSDEKNRQLFYSISETFLGKTYDLTFEWSDTRMYCSELVWKIYDRALGVQIGQLSKLRDFDLSSPAVKIKIKERYNGKPPLEESVISPEAMFNSSLLFEVARG